MDPATLPDEDLARETREGSLECFEELVRRHEGRLYHFLARACRNDADGADLTQDTFVTAYKKLDRYNAEQSFVTWLFTIARRKCIDHLRARRSAGDDAMPEPVNEDSPAELLARRDETADLWRRIRAALPQVQFEALWLKYVEELSVAEIAAILGRTQIHVKVILFRARTKLASALGQPVAEKIPPAKPSQAGDQGNSNSRVNSRSTP